MSGRISFGLITQFLLGSFFFSSGITQDSPLDTLGVILQPQGDTFESDRVFNPSVIVEGDTMFMIYRAQGQGMWNASFIALAKSTDGINFSRYQGNPLLRGEDPRVVKFESTYYLFYNNIEQATSSDLINWERQGSILSPLNDWESAQVKAPGPVPEKISGEYWMYYQGEKEAWRTKMGLAYSYNLLDWGRLQDPVMTPREGYFDSWGTEPGVAVMIEEGIFMIYNGWGGDGTNRNMVGWVLFDKQDPSRIIARCDTPFVCMETDHVFCEGLTMFNDQWHLYWGAADQWIEGAILDIDKLIDGAVHVEEIPDHLPSDYVLEQNYPNPFNPSTTIGFSLPKSSQVNLKVYNLLGQEVKTIVNEYRTAGYHQIFWDGTDASGKLVAGGVYIYTLKAGEYKKAIKIVLIQ